MSLNSMSSSSTDGSVPHEVPRTKYEGLGGPSDITSSAADADLRLEHVDVDLRATSVGARRRRVGPRRRGRLVGPARRR